MIDGTGVTTGAWRENRDKRMSTRRYASLLRYPGGKRHLVPLFSELVRRLDANVFIEPFAGGAACGLELLRKGDVEAFFLNDLDSGVASLWAALADSPDDLLAMIEKCEISVDEWHRHKKIYKNLDEYERIEQAFSTLFLNRTSQLGVLGKAGIIGGKDQRGNHKIDCRFNRGNLARFVREFKERGRFLLVSNMQATSYLLKIVELTSVLERFLGFTGAVKKQLVYLDPPYLNVGDALYGSPYAVEDYVKLATLLRKLTNNSIPWIMSHNRNRDILNIYESSFCAEYTGRGGKKDMLFWDSPLLTETIINWAK